MNTVDCVLLAAGASSRMGEPKLLAPLGGGTLFEAVLDNHLAGSLGSVCAVVPGWIPDFARLARGRAHGRLAFVRMPAPCPMSESLKSGWAWVCGHRDPGGVMISLADKPLVGPAIIDAVVAAYLAGGCLACVPTYRGTWGHPVVLSPALGPEVMAIGGDRGCLEVLRRHGAEVLEMPVESDEVVFDVDSPDDLAALRARWQGRE